MEFFIFVCDGFFSPILSSYSQDLDSMRSYIWNSGRKVLTLFVDLAKIPKVSYILFMLHSLLYSAEFCAQ